MPPLNTSYSKFEYCALIPLELPYRLSDAVIGPKTFLSTRLLANADVTVKPPLEQEKGYGNIANLHGKVCL
jgi:hypothetical protein